MKKTRILIVGGAGYVGGFMVDVLLNQNYEVFVYDNLIYEDRYLKRVKFIYGDVRDREYLISLFKSYKFDIIIWLAAIVGDGACEVDPWLTQAIN